MVPGVIHNHYAVWRTNCLYRLVCFSIVWLTKRWQKIVQVFAVGGYFELCLNGSVFYLVTCVLLCSTERLDCEWYDVRLVNFVKMVTIGSKHFT